ncbi:M48 family metallopeptidase [Steroidobacter sp.]|uniref:M48 family metallopeptidase n=1 Tax=Steroidobacter sp. TaxID=1978227 RepID=UPI001A3BA01D|nr:M48 family metallopeptidase [Steroidobacter sp.]MBL8271774.1 M48 family metalloprotease [Steroidobacter sp.]
MERHEFSALIGRLERQADDNPQFYAVKVGALAALGYASIVVLAGIILITFWYTFSPLLSGERFRAPLVIACAVGLVTLVGMIRALWVRIAEPSGLRISRDEAPKLYAAIDEVARKMGGVKVDSVSVSAEINACIVQIPRWGIFGNYSNHLEIGLPLAMVLTVDELKAVMAHEMGHLSQAHGKFGAWIYRQRVTWHALESKFSNPVGIFDQVLGAFYGWYAPYFYAYSFVLARNQEYVADRAAAHVTSAAAIGAALTKLELAGRFLSEVFWKRLYDQVEKQPAPPYMPHSVMPRAFKAAEQQWARPDWLQQSLRRYAADDDTHPSLAERLAALDIEPSTPVHDPDRSALSLFQPSTTALLKFFDDEWQQDTAPKWRKRHIEIAEAKAKLTLMEDAQTEALNDQEAWEKALLQLEIDREDLAMETLEQLLSRNGEFPKAHLLMGRMLLERADDRGLKHLLLAVEQDLELTDEAGRAGYVYLLRRGREQEAKRFWSKAQDLYENPRHMRDSLAE